MSEQKQKRGLRCHICTGCGLCPGVGGNGTNREKPHVLDEDALLGKREPLPGKKRLAVADIGTTTIAMLLYRQDGSVEERFAGVNPQTEYGADVLSRIRAAENQNVAEKLKEQVEGVLEKGISRFRKKLMPEEEMILVLAANTTMTYLLLGRNSRELGQAPFHASFLQGVETEISGVRVYVFPGMSAFVGGDILAGVCACKMDVSEEITLLVDLGTNGEMVLGNRQKRLACATAAGPAFEGGVNRGIWGADMISLLARLREEGRLDETGLLAEPYFETGIRIGNVLVTEEAIRSVQLAKAAIAAGIEILMTGYGITEEKIERVVLAGGFGYYLKPEAAAQIGLLPEKLAKKTFSGGNTVLSGTLMTGRKLLGGADWSDTERYLEQVAGETKVLNLAEQPAFKDRYICHMNLK